VSEQPRLLVGWDEIGQAFGVGRDRAREWQSMGAPIFRERERDKPVAELSELWAWFRELCEQ